MCIRDSVGFQAARPVRIDHLEYVALAVFEIAEVLRVGRAGDDARRFRSALETRHTEVALVDLLRRGIDIAGVVRTGLQAESAPDTQALVHAHDAIVMLRRGARWACLDTGRSIALITPVSYTHLRAHETRHDLVCRLLLEKKKKKNKTQIQKNKKSNKHKTKKNIKKLY